MLTYHRAAELLGTKQSKKLNNNTYLERAGDVFVIRLHSTDIVKIRPNGTYVLSVGEYPTATTVRRINDYAPVYVRRLKGKLHYWRNGSQFEFYNGLTVDVYGQLCS